MENIKLDNIDIESCKELFAYEMTEVILKLKGEFASVSGKDTKYAEVAVDEQKMQISPVSIPAVVLEGSVHSFAECKNVAFVQSLPQYEVKASVFTLPSVPTITSKSGIDIQVSKTELNVLRPTAVNCAVLPEVQIEMCSLPSFKPRSIRLPLVEQTKIEVSVQQFTDVKKPKVASVATPKVVLENISMPRIPEIHQKTPKNVFACETSTHPTNFHSFESINIPNIKKSLPRRIFEAKINKESVGTVPKIPDVHIEQTSVSPIKGFSFVQPKKIKVTKQLATVATKSTYVRVPTVSKCAVGISVFNTEPKKMNIDVVCPAMVELSKPFAGIKISKSSNLAIPTNTDH